MVFLFADSAREIEVPERKPYKSVLSDLSANGMEASLQKYCNFIDIFSVLW